MSGGAAFVHDLRFTLEAVWKVLLASLVLGAGLPAIFALGIRSLAWGAGGEARASEGQPGHAPGNRAGRVIAGVLFAIVLYGVASGILFIIASGQGKDISFAHVVPTIHG